MMLREFVVTTLKLFSQYRHQAEKKVQHLAKAS